MNTPFFRKATILTGALLLLWLFARFLLPIMMPFLLAALLALCAEPLVSVFQKRLRLPRSVAAGIGVIIALGVAVLILMTLISLLLRQLGQLSGVLPDLEETAVRGMESLEGYLVSLASRAPGTTGELLSGGVKNFFSDGTAMVNQVTGRLLTAATGFVTQIPDSALGFGTWLLASFMISAKLPKIRQWTQKQLSGHRQQQVLTGLKRLKKNILGWLSAQAKLLGVTFLLLTGSFWILQINHAPLWAAIIALVDALPVLGTGTVLVPWSIVCFLQGQSVRAIGLLGTYVAVWITHSVLEPRFVGKKLGLDPLVTLIAMYAGYRIWGLLGMIFSPLLAVTVAQVLTATKEQE